MGASFKEGMQCCQMVYFHTEKTYYRGPRNKKTFIHLMVMWYTYIFYDHLVNFVVVWYIFTRFGLFNQEKSGSPETMYVCVNQLPSSDSKTEAVFIIKDDKSTQAYIHLHTYLFVLGRMLNNNNT
jgi:hypothetical protein